MALSRVSADRERAPQLPHIAPTLVKMKTSTPTPLKSHTTTYWSSLVAIFYTQFELNWRYKMVVACARDILFVNLHLLSNDY